MDEFDTPDERDGFQIVASEDPDDYEVYVEGAIPSIRPSGRSDGRYLYLRVLSKWTFHKTDADPWPSELHGHHSHLPHKLDAITGNVFDVRTKERFARLKRKELTRIQSALAASKDFGARATVLFDITAG